MKAAALELNGILKQSFIIFNSFSDSALAYVNAVNASYKHIRLCVPLMILIDELGYR
jgi:hypothetical protein